MKSKERILMEINATDIYYLLKDDKESKLIYTLKRYALKVKLFCTQGFPKDGDYYE
jgi:hypothetical protein